MQRFKPKRYEEYGYVLDVFPASRKPGYQVARNELVVQLLGEEYFTLLEAAVNEKNKPQVGSRIYIGREAPRELIRIIRRIGVNDLTESAKINLENIVQRIVVEHERRFVEFFNRSNPLSPRLHALELIPGVGKKVLQKVLEERDTKPFESYEDIKKRVGLLDPPSSIARRIIDELLRKDERYHIFVREFH